MMIISDICTIKVINDTSTGVNDASRSIIDDSNCHSELWHHLYDNHDDSNVFIVKAVLGLVNTN